MIVAADTEVREAASAHKAETLLLQTLVRTVIMSHHNIILSYLLCNTNCSLTHRERDCFCRG